MSLKNWKGIYE